MRRRLRLHPDGWDRHLDWCARPDTDPEDVRLVREVLIALAVDGWPPAEKDDEGRSVPRWPYFEDPSSPRHCVVAPAEHLWVVIRLPEAGEEYFDLVTVHYPTEPEKAASPWLQPWFSP